MKIAIIGPGAMGCLFAAFLAKKDQDVWLLDNSPERAKRIREEGDGEQQLENCINVVDDNMGSYIPRWLHNTIYYDFRFWSAWF